MGIIHNLYYVRNRKTGEVAFVELGARYDQALWELCHLVPTDLGEVAHG